MKSIIKLVLLVSILEIVFFLLMVFTSMTDEKPAAIGRVFYILLKYVFGYPIALINNEYPFFLDSSKMPTFGFLLIILNNIIIVIIIKAVFHVIRKMKK